MKLMYWRFNDIMIPMLEDDDGNLFCTSAVLCNALGINENSLRSIHMEHNRRFSDLSVGNSHAKEFLNDHRATFGIKRMRGDMRLWTESDMITFAMLSNSDVAVEFQSNIIQLVKDNARRGHVSQEDYDRLSEQLAYALGELNKLKDVFKASRPAVNRALRDN